MLLEDITEVESRKGFSKLVYLVKLNNGLILSVPDNPDNTDWEAVQQWIHLNKKK